MKFVQYVMFAQACFYANAMNESKACDQQKIKNLCTSIITLPFSKPYLAYADGRAFNYHTVARDVFDEKCLFQNNFIVRYDGRGALHKFRDGMSVPLLLGSMPRDDDSIEELKRIYGLKRGDRIAIHSMNLPFEIAWGGLGSLVKRDSSLRLLSYPTIDECAPDIVDALRVLKRLMHRDELQYDLHYLHCLAGRGRSATIAVLYMLCCLNNKKISIAPDEVLNYVKKSRPQIHPSDEQMQFIKDFHQLLEQTKDGLDGLCDLYAPAIMRRERECAYSVVAERVDLQAGLYADLKCFMVIVISLFAGMVYKSIGASL